jgi:hypothetical protein
VRSSSPTSSASGGAGSLPARQESVRSYVRLLAEFGIGLKHPYCSGIAGSKHSHLRELRVQHQGRPYRVLYAFDPRRAALLLIGGDKTGNDRWYEVFVPIADRLYDAHLEQLRAERKEDGEEI